MKRLALLGVLALLTSSVASFERVRSSEPGYRADKDEPRLCSTETLEGVYGLSIGGTRPAPTFPPGTVEQLIGVGTRTFDGDGNFTQVTNEKGSLTGIMFPNRSLSGTYKVDPDCTGTLTLNIPGLPFSVVYDLVIVNGGREFRSIVASPAAVMVTTDGKRQ